MVMALRKYRKTALEFTKPNAEKTGNLGNYLRYRSWIAISDEIML